MYSDIPVYAVAGKNYGDEGKGLATDYFVLKRTSCPSDSLVIRHNGGAQAGHTVDMSDGRRFVFHQLSSGSFRGASTLWADTFMPDLYKLEGGFDVVVSSLAIHYVEDYKGVLREVNRLLKKGGEFIFSQEHPVNSCYGGGERWTKDENGIKIYSNLANYSIEGERESTWFVDNVKKYHRMFSTVINDLIDAGFAIERLTEPVPTKELVEKYPDYYDLYHRPDFLLVKARKI